MSIARKVGILGFAGVVSVSNLLGCGSVSNNDQGTSFISTGYYDCTDADSFDDCSGVSESTAILTSISPGALGTLLIDGNRVSLSIGVANRLEGQFINVKKIDCRYDVPGSTLQIPTDSIPVSGSVGPSIPETGEATVPEENVLGIGFSVLSPSIITYLAANQNLLPALPFRLIATCSVTGVTEAGDTLTTNEVSLPITFVDASEIQGETGQGGTIPTGTDSGGDAASAELEDESEESSSSEGVVSDGFELKQ